MSTGAVHIREMAAQDIPRILEIDQKLSGRSRSPSWPQGVKKYLERYYPPLCYVAEVDGKVVGFILGDVRGWEYAEPAGGWIDIMGVVPGFQGQGIGRKLALAFAEECQKKRMKAHIMVRRGDERLGQFLLSLGFQPGDLTEFVKQ